ncbi:hypothetical protein R3Q06_20550 [Rhodococcus erythropolis]|uniref:hypothetical protein n=1 Tax=Rhodococcus erythropolis TaxID=1833 RepID=UPI00294A0CD9|nr:hypothetical protein [Rhodococcus erythropolis]MDV6275889.1 hypothetical protein [Rhodococcus erythropolis]
MNGIPAAAESLAPLVVAGYVHFNAMQVGDSVRGVDLHLNRLRAASEALYGSAGAGDTVRAHLRSAVDTSSVHSLSDLPAVCWPRLD